MAGTNLMHFRICFQVLDGLLAGALEPGPHWKDTASLVAISVDKRKTESGTDQTLLLATTTRLVPEQSRTILAGLEQKQAADDIRPRLRSCRTYAARYMMSYTRASKGGATS
jgi:hypothetical protein